MDLSQLPPEIAALLFVGGAERADLQWQSRQRKIAKNKLDASDDNQLFGNKPLLDESMAAAVRSLLYMWNGYPAEAMMLAEAAPDRERHYLIGFQERQLGNAARAKEMFQRVQTHPIHESLVAYAMETVALTEDPLLLRLKQFLETYASWEAHLFTDVMEQTLSGKAMSEAVHAACLIQCREFELLFDFCYGKTVGEELASKPAETPAEQEEALKRLRKLRERQHMAAHLARRVLQKSPEPSSKDDKPPAKGSSATATLQSTFKIACPKCGVVTSVMESSRGQQGQCKSCGVVYRIPTK